MAIVLDDEGKIFIKDGKPTTSTDCCCCDCPYLACTTSTGCHRQCTYHECAGSGNSWIPTECTTTVGNPVCFTDSPQNGGEKLIDNAPCPNQDCNSFSGETIMGSLP